MRFIYIIALLLAFAVQGAEVRTYTTSQGDTLTLLDTPCVSMAGAFAHYPLEHRQPGIKAAVMVWKGKRLDACWLVHDGLTLIVDETGDSGAVEGSVFDPVRGRQRF